MRYMLKSRLIRAAFTTTCAAAGIAQTSQPAATQSAPAALESQPAAAPPVRSWLDEWRAPFDGPISTDRPDFSESTGVVPRGRFQFETGYTFTRDSELGTRTGEHTFPEILLRMGLATDWELRIGWTGFSLGEEVFRAPNEAGRTRTFREHDDGGTDMNIGVKRHLLDQSGLVPDFGVIAALTLPTGAGGKSAGDVDPEIKLLWGYELTDRLAIAGNVNVAVPSDELGRFFQSSASVSLGHSINDWVGTYVEYFGFYPNERGTDCAHYVNTGLVFPITEDFQIDLRIGTGLNEEADDLFAGIGFAFRF